MFSYRKSLIIAAALLIGSSAYAQEKVSLESAIKYALQNKAEAVKARLDVENSQYLIEEARAGALPQINGNASLTHNAILQQMALTMGGQTTVIKMGQPWQSNAAVQLDQQIFNMAVFTGLQAARSTREFYLINESLTEEQIIEKVANSYYEVFKSKSQLATIDKTIANSMRVKDVLISLYQNGLSKKIDLDRMSVSLNNLLSSKQQVINAIQIQENALKYLIGMKIDTPIELPDNSFEINEYAHVEKIDAATVENRTEIKLLEKQGELLNFNKKAINVQRYPTLGFSANYGYLGLGSKFPYFAGKDNGVNWSDFSALSLNLRVPIFAGFGTRAKVRKAQIEIDKFEVDLNDTKLALSLDLENAKTQISNALITLNAQKANMALAKEVLSNVENNYKNGLATLTDLLDAENSYADAQNNHTNAVLSYKLAEVKLVKSKGELKSFYTQQN